MSIVSIPLNRSGHACVLPSHHDPSLSAGCRCRPLQEGVSTDTGGGVPGVWCGCVDRVLPARLPHYGIAASPLSPWVNYAARLTSSQQAKGDSVLFALLEPAPGQLIIHSAQLIIHSAPTDSAIEAQCDRAQFDNKIASVFPCARSGNRTRVAPATTNAWALEM